MAQTSYAEFRATAKRIDRLVWLERYMCCCCFGSQVIKQWDLLQDQARGTISQYDALEAKGWMGPELRAVKIASCNKVRRQLEETRAELLTQGYDISFRCVEGPLGPVDVTPAEPVLVRANYMIYAPPDKLVPGGKEYASVAELRADRPASLRPTNREASGMLEMDYAEPT